MGEIDLDILRAARAETKDEPHTVTLGGETFRLPVEVPIEASLALRSGDVIAFTQHIVDGGEAEWKRFLGVQPTIQDCWALVEQLGKLIAVSPPESVASGSSSKSNGARSRRTSNASTASTSASPSSDTNASASVAS